MGVICLRPKSRTRRR